ncbi:MAG: 3-isopropylmalate dehydratase small subunit [Methyloligellaceae bacterium]
MSEEQGRAWVFGDNIDTDQLAPGSYIKGPIEELVPHCLERVDPQFASQVRPGDIVIGGSSFGIGSSREQAAQALKLLGVRAVIAKSFGGIFYRNALNFGLLALVCPQAGEISQGDRLSLDAAAGEIINHTQAETYACEPVPPHLLEMVQAGGLVPYLEKRLAGAA